MTHVGSFIQTVGVRLECIWDAELEHPGLGLVELHGLGGRLDTVRTSASQSPITFRTAHLIPALTVVFLAEPDSTEN